MGRRQTPETREKIRQAALTRPRVPRAKRSTSEKAGRDFARRWFALPDICERCREAPPLDRHHKDGNPQNNAADNIAFLCRRCHQVEDGRYERLKHEIPSLGGRSRRKQSATHDCRMAAGRLAQLSLLTDVPA